MDKRYLKIYNSQNDYDNNWLNELEVPHVVYIEETDEVIFKDAEPKVDYSTQYFTLEALENGTMEIGIPIFFSSCKYAHNDGDWIQTNDAISLNVSTNDTIKIACVTDSGDVRDFSLFNCSCKFNVYGNAMSLIYGDDFIGQTNLEGKDYCFSFLFQYNTNLLSAENLVLPATTLAEGCYGGMFQYCTSLTTAPELPATTLANNCYGSMFSNCTSLTTAPFEIPATTLAYECCCCMFSECTALTTAPELPATTLADYCYSQMFTNCTSLTTAPELPATTLAKGCYDGMFFQCTSLTIAPELPATTLAERCYEGMFRGCTSLTTAPELPATTLANYCYILMFTDCSKLNYIKALFTTTPSSTYTSGWVTGVASNGTFVKNANATWNVNGEDGIPNGWTVETA